jgi:hypothetical protein
LPAALTTATFQYEPLGRHTKKVVSNTNARFHYDGDNPVQALSATGAA